MIRKDREIKDINDILDVMRRSAVCRIALNDNGYPYIIPLNFGMKASGEKIELFFHSALRGHKLELIERDNRAGFEMDGEHSLQYFEDKGYCTFSYESVAGKGRIEIVPDEEKAEALQLLMNHYHHGENAYFNPAAIPRTTVYKLIVEEISGKRKEPVK